jgi:hypothetical protein
VVFFLVVIYLILNFKKINLSEKALIIIFGYLSLTAVRHIPFFLIVSSLQLAEVINNLIKKLTKKIQDKILLIPLLFIFFGLSIYSIMQIPLIFKKNISSLKNDFPYDATNFLKNNYKGGNIFTTSWYGGYILYKLYPDFKVAIDVRSTSVYDVKYYQIALSLPYGYYNYKTFFKNYPTDFILLPKKMLLSFYLLKDNTYKKIYQDKRNVVFIKNE